MNGDGFGVGWYSYDHPTPCIFTSISPAWNNRNLHRLSHKITSPLFFAHIRAATHGSPTNESNCHPFQYKQYMWMHNGAIADFHLIKKKIIGYLSDACFNLVQGTTDSEYGFVLFLQVLYNMTGKSVEYMSGYVDSESDEDYCTPEVLKEAMVETINLLNTWIKESGSQNSSMMNFCITDGRTVVATRYANFAHGPAASLFFSSGTNFQRNPTQPDSFMMSQADRRQMCHIITSEPLTDDEDDWVQVPRNHVLVVTPQSNLLIYPLPESSLEECGADAPQK